MVMMARKIKHAIDNMSLDFLVHAAKEIKKR
jgi:hypothetical protein